MESLKVAEKDFASKGCLVSIRIRRPTLTTKLNWEQLGIPDAVEKLANAPSTKPPSDDYNNFIRLEQRMRNVIRRYSIGDADGFRFMPWANFEKCVVEIEALKQEFMGYVHIFGGKYEEYVESTVSKWREQGYDIYDGLLSPAISRSDFVDRIEGKIRASLPSTKGLSERFSVSLKVLQFSMPDAAAAGVNDAPLVLKYAKQLAEESFQGFFADVANELRQRTAELTAHVLEVMQRSGQLTEKSVKPVREYVKLFESLNVVGDAEVASYIQKLEEFLNNSTAKGMTEDANKFGQFSSLLSQATQFGKALTDEQVKEQVASLYGAGIGGRKLLM